jgi:hypothetical protein
VVSLLLRLLTSDNEQVEEGALIALQEFMAMPLSKMMSESQLNKLFGGIF